MDMPSGAGSKPAQFQRGNGGNRQAQVRTKNTRHNGRGDVLAIRDSGEEIYGALDLGTNNCRLLLATPGPDGFKVIDAFSRIVRLGEGVSRTGKLSDEAMQRTISAVRVCANKLKWWRVGRFRLIATEACRMATNGMEFIENLADQTGIHLEVIDRETEAVLAAAGASALICPNAKTVLIFDIGGGSTELMWLTVNNGSSTIERWISIPAGVVTLSEWFGGKDVTEADFLKMREHVRPMLTEFAAKLHKLDPSFSVPDHLLGTSGTVTTICGIQLGLRRYDRSKVDGSWIINEDIGEVTAQLLAMNYRQRAASPCIGRERADLVLAGCAILEEIRQIWPANRVRVADRGLREGILTQMMNEDGVYGRS